jgi:hypothetical protein
VGLTEQVRHFFSAAATRIAWTAAFRCGFLRGWVGNASYSEYCIMKKNGKKLKIRLDCARAENPPKILDNSK